MTLTLSPEVEADIREIMRLWGWDAGDQVKAEAVARGVLAEGLRTAIEVARRISHREAWADNPLPVLRSKIMKCRTCGSEQQVSIGSPSDKDGLCCDCYWENIRQKPLPQSVPDARVFEEPLSQSPVIPDGTEVSTAGGRLLVWRGGKWWAKEEGGAK